MVALSKEDMGAKRDSIVALFNYYSKKIANLYKILDHGFVEEALILAFCYICALANLRYKANERDNFIKIIYEYSENKDLFSKISWIYFYKKGKEHSEKNNAGIPISHYEDIKRSLLKIYYKKSDHHKEMDKNRMIDYLKQQLTNLDMRNLEANLDKFSYAAVLYEKYRSAGVHEGGMAHSWNETGEPLFNKNVQGEDIYYNGNILCFSKEIIFDILKIIHNNLKK